MSISLGYQDCFYLRQIQIGILVDGNKGLLINYLERAWQDSGVHDFAHGPSRILQVFKSGHGSGGQRWLGINLEGYLGYYSQCSFRTDKKLGQIITRRAFHTLGSCAHNPTIGEYYLKGKDIILGRAVFGTFDSAGIRGHVTAQGGNRAACRVRWKKEVVWCQGPFQVCIDHTGLNNCQAVRHAD